MKEIPFFNYSKLYCENADEYNRIFSNTCSKGSFIMQEELSSFEDSLANFLGCKYAVPIMGKYRHGSIINISSISGIVAGWNTAAYNSSKAGVRHLSKSVALFCAKKGYDVRCNSIHPAFVNTPILDPIKQAFGAEEAVAKLSRQIPMNKIGDTDDVSYAILYLASEESKFMTGSEIVLDGGLSAM